jgi:tRNA pseudouridine55 synthase
MNSPGPAGYLLLNKNPGLTSFESLIPVKKALGTGKVCHSGTLDKFARGLLVVLTGRAVKLFPWFSGCGKSYRALLRFGEETDTLDPEGAVIAAGPVPSREALEAIFPAFTGTIEQAPPLYSAIHVDGKRAHELARQGRAPEMKKRPVTVYGLSLLTWDPPHAELEIRCSSGTYIRSLARDLALAANSRSHLRELTRTAVGDFSLDEALRLPERTTADRGVAGRETIRTETDGGSGDAGAGAADRIRGALRPLDGELFARLGIPSLAVDGAAERILSRGGDLQALMAVLAPPRKTGAAESGPDGGVSGAANRTLALFGPGGKAPDGGALAALVEERSGRWRYGFVAAGG